MRAIYCKSSTAFTKILAVLFMRLILHSRH